MESQKQVKNALATLEKILWIQQEQLKDNKQYFHDLLRDNATTLAVMLVPAFIAGWQSGKLPNLGRKLKHFGKYFGPALISQFKQR